MEKQTSNSIEEKNKENSLRSKEKTNCTLCGECKFFCPFYKLFFDESISPRGKATMLKEEFPSKYLYLCTLCKACEESCILKNIDLVDKIRSFRENLVNKGITTKPNKVMIENIRKFGNPFGKIEPGEKINLYCC